MWGMTETGGGTEEARSQILEVSVPNDCCKIPITLIIGLALTTSCPSGLVTCTAAAGVFYRAVLRGRCLRGALPFKLISDLPEMRFSCLSCSSVVSIHTLPSAMFSHLPSGTHPSR